MRRFGARLVRTEGTATSKKEILEFINENFPKARAREDRREKPQKGSGIFFIKFHAHGSPEARNMLKTLPSDAVQKFKIWGA